MLQLEYYIFENVVTTRRRRRDASDDRTRCYKILYTDGHHGRSPLPSQSPPTLQPYTIPPRHRDCIAFDCFENVHFYVITEK